MLCTGRVSWKVVEENLRDSLIVVLHKNELG